MVGARGFEPPTSATPLQRAIQAAPRPDRQSDRRILRTERGSLADPLVRLRNRIFPLHRGIGPQVPPHFRPKKEWSWHPSPSFASPQSPSCTERPMCPLRPAWLSSGLPTSGWRPTRPPLRIQLIPPPSSAAAHFSIPNLLLGPIRPGFPDLPRVQFQTPAPPVHLWQWPWLRKWILGAKSPA